MWFLAVLILGALVAAYVLGANESKQTGMWRGLGPVTGDGTPKPEQAKL